MSGRRSGAEQLLERIAELGWNQLELSRRIDASTAVVSRWLAGQRKPSLEMAFRIQSATGLAADAWLEDPIDVADDSGEHGSIDDLV